MALTPLHSAVFKLLRPLVRILMNHGISYAEFTEMAKRAFVDIAETDFQIAGRKQTISRVSMLTGIQRKEVSRLRQAGPIDDSELDAAYNRAVRVISGWCRDEQFSLGDGTPLPLPFDGEISFSALAKRYSGDIPARAVLDELIRVGTVTRNTKEEICLVNESGHVPHTGKEAQFNIMGSAGSDLIETIAHNLESSPRETRLQLSVAYNNLPVHAVRRFKQFSHDDSVDLLKKFDKWLANEDRDGGGDAPVEDGRFRAGIGIYYFEEPVSTSQDQESSS